MTQANDDHTPNATPLISGKTAITLLDTVSQLNREATQPSVETGEVIKTQIISAEKALNDITDIAGILRRLAALQITGADEIDGTQIDLLARLLEDRAEAVYDVVSTTANWAPSAQAALYAVAGLGEGAAA
ncbi:MAG: hypothetical protein B7Y73_02975 [Acidocella sp. 35-58-6]|nr:MAG: hypothetical protein B7Y73_02975 [Acidocella sp. 35-58-6]